MPIKVCSVADVRRLPESDFKEIAYAVTGAAFDVHNRYGRFFGGEDSVIRPIPVIRDGKQVSTQFVHLNSPGIAFKLTALPDRLDVVEEHMRRFLHHTRLRAIQWINLYRHEVRFVSLIDAQ